ncbi:MAG: DEAD/DEAH box helicase [Simkaniaceae bacterium]
MQKDFSFTEQQLIAGESLLREKRVLEVIFSEGTYQIEMEDPSQKEMLWPFLQLDDEGEIQDCFCSCQEFEKYSACKHLAAAVLRIFNQQIEPLHVRFRRSFWNRLCFLNFEKIGPEADLFIESSSQEYEYFSSSKKLLFSIKAKTKKAKEKLEEIFFHRVLETEETSLKFSNLPMEEIALWKKGRPSETLRYELSFWSDLGKWLMLLQDEKSPYSVSFDHLDELPSYIKAEFSDLKLLSYISEADWKKIIPSLKTINTPLPVFDFPFFTINKLAYDEQEKCFFIDSSPISLPKEEMKQISLGEWNFVPNVGFVTKKADPIFQNKVIPKEKIQGFFEKHLPTIEKYLENTVIHRGKFPVNYHLEFHEGRGLQIQAYLFEKGDLTKKASAFFGQWAYIAGKGFYHLENLVFNTVEKRIAIKDLGQFIHKHQNWLNQFEGFEIHIGSLQTYELTYEMTAEGLLLKSKEEADQVEGLIDIGEWVYIKGKGFYPKRKDRFSKLKPGTLVPWEEIASFLEKHRDELEQIKDFFLVKEVLKAVGLKIYLSKNQRIQIEPIYEFLPPYKKLKNLIFEPFIYIPGHGFAEIPSEKRLPKQFRKKQAVSKEEEAFFLGYEIDALSPFILELDSRLKKPDFGYLKLHTIRQEDRHWVVSLSYITEIGSVPIKKIYEAYKSKKNFLLSEGGLLLLKTPRFQWLRNIRNESFIDDASLKLSSLEWIKLSVFEEIHPPKKHEEGYDNWAYYYQKFFTFSTEEDLHLKGLKSTLRPYQEAGVRWLWFLYRQGLSGLLCDDMGLGKTHQAMALLAAVKNHMGRRRKKYLVVCPTSVMYHWEELLKRFLPGFKVLVFHGVSRSLKGFKQKYDLLVTSYGIIRTEKENLSKIAFEIAIFDEMQIAKNKHSRTHKSLRQLHAAMVVGLSGTPIENRLTELKALFDIILPNYLPMDARFQENFINPIEKQGSTEKKQLLSRIIRPFLLRRRKEEVLADLPDKTEEISYCDLSEEQKKLYQEYFIKNREAVYESLKEKDAPYLHVFSLFNTLKIICNHPCLHSDTFKNYKQHKSGKWELFLELLDETRQSGQKLVVFSQYLGMLDIIETFLKEQKISFASIRGETKERGREVKRFQEDPSCEVFVGSLKAAGVGIDLTAGSVVVHYDRWWNPAKEDQATDRVHRIGQNRGVQVFKLVTKNTIEEHIHDLIERKKGLIEEIVGYDEEKAMKNFSKEEIEFLLRKINEDITSLQKNTK